MQGEAEVCLRYCARALLGAKILGVMSCLSFAGTRRMHAALWLAFLVTATSSISLCADKREPLVIVKNGKYGYIDHEGKIVIQPQFVWAEDFWRGLGTVYVCGRYVSIDSSGSLHPLRITVEGHLEAKQSEGMFGFVDASGQLKIRPTFDEALPFSEGLAAVRVGDKWGFIDDRGAEVVPPQFKGAYYFREGVGAVNIGGDYAVIDKSGKVLARGLQSVGFVADGRVPVTRGGKEGYLDLQGKVVVPLVYDAAMPFSSGLAAVRRDDKWGYVDREGKIAIPFRLEEAGQFASGLAPARVGAKSGFINKSGAFAFYLPFRQAAGFLTGDEESNLFIAESDVSRFWTADDKFGYVETSGRVIWEAPGGGPDHPPVLGWDEDDKVRSCEGIPESIKSTIASFPQR